MSNSAHLELIITNSDNRRITSDQLDEIIYSLLDWAENHDFHIMITSELLEE